MKLYTEEQMHSAMLLALGRHGIYIPNKHYQDLIDLLTPIELPSDEDVREAKDKHQLGGYVWQEEKRKSFSEGAKWMRNQIQGGNK